MNRLGRPIASLSLLALFLVGCGANTDPGERITVKNDSIRARRDAGEALGDTSETQARARQRERVNNFKANGVSADSLDSSTTKGRTTSSYSSGGGYRGSSWNSITGAGAWQSLGTLAMMAAIFKGADYLSGGEKSDKKKDKPERKPREQEAHEGNSNQNTNRAEQISRRMIQVIDPSATPTNEQNEAGTMPDEDIICFFGSEQKYQDVKDIFNSAPGRGV